MSSGCQPFGAVLVIPEIPIHLALAPDGEGFFLICEFKMAENRKPSKGKSLPTSEEPKLGQFGEQVSEFVDEHAGDATFSERFPVQDRIRELQQRAARLREAAEAAGGNRILSNLSGVAYGTLNDYLAGGEMKVSNAIALAEAAGVRLEWLLTGAGEMREGEAARPQSDPVPTMDQIDEANLIWALDFAERQAGRDIPADKRVDLMLFAAAEFRRTQRMPPLPAFDAYLLAASLHFIEEIVKAKGWTATTGDRVHLMLVSYGKASGWFENPKL